MLTKRGNECFLNTIGSFQEVTWRLFQDWSLDVNFQYDEFEGYFNLLQRASGQTLLMFVADHEETYRNLQQQRSIFRPQFRAGICCDVPPSPREQRQRSPEGPELGEERCEKALYLLLGQDYKGGTWLMERKRVQQSCLQA